MKSFIFLMLFFAIAMLYVARPTLTIKPFSLTFERGLYALGLTLILVGVQLVAFGTRRETTKNLIKIVNTSIEEMRAKDSNLINNNEEK